MSESTEQGRMGGSIAYFRARYTTRCMVCGVQIEKGSVIATPTDDRTIIRNAKTKARWAHPSCLTDALRITGSVSSMSAARGFRQREKRRRAKARQPEAEQNPTPVEDQLKEKQ